MQRQTLMLDDNESVWDDFSHDEKVIINGNTVEPPLEEEEGGQPPQQQKQQKYQPSNLLIGSKRMECGVSMGYVEQAKKGWVCGVDDRRALVEKQGEEYEARLKSLEDKIKILQEEVQQQKAEHATQMEALRAEHAAQWKTVNEDMRIVTKVVVEKFKKHKTLNGASNE